MAVATVLDQAQAPRQPIDLRSRLQSIITFDVDEVLSSNTLVSGQEERNWTTLLQAFWAVLQNADGTNKPTFPEERDGKGGKSPSFGGDGCWPEVPGGAGDD